MSGEGWLLVFVVVAFLGSLGLTGILTRYSARLGLLDLPNDRKVHSTPTPRSGGIAFVTASLLASAGFLWLFSPAQSGSAHSLGWTGLFGLGIAILGVIDDVRSLSWKLRLSLHFLLVSSAVVLALPSMRGFSPWITHPLIVIWIVGLVNAMNMLDNMDWLSGGVAWLILGSIVCAGLLLGDPWLSNFFYLLVMAGLLGFLWHNYPPARIFMGDGGSTFLGFVLGMASARLLLRQTKASPGLAVPILLLAVPWYDLLTVVWIRYRQGRSPFHADKQHLSHRLTDRGLRSVTAVRVIHLITLANASLSLLLYQATTVGSLIVGVSWVGWWMVVTILSWKTTD